jgi:hypothetical protein
MGFAAGLPAGTMGFAGDLATGAIGFLLAGADVFVEPALSPLILRVVDSVEFVTPSAGLLYAVETKLNANNAMANVHVVFSKKSAVLRTPITWFDEEKEDANPPPFEF